MKTNYSLHLILFLTFLFNFFSRSSYAQVENCLDFNGTGDYVRMGNVNNLGSSDFTIEAWINIENTFENKVITKGGSIYQSPASTGYGLRTSYSGSGILDFFVGEGSLTIVKYDGIQTNTWYHVAGVRRGTELLLYLDGVLVGSKTAPFVYNTNNNGPFAIGAMDKGPNSSIVDEFMDGKIDEVRIWNIARTQEEIQNNKDCAISSPEAHLIAVYNFDQVNGSILFDKSGNGAHGQFVNNPIWNPSSVAPNCSVITVKEDVLVSDFTLYPNPANERVFLKSERTDYNELRVMDIEGKVVLVQIDQFESIDVSNLSKGIYIVHLVKGDKITTKRFVKF